MKFVIQRVKSASVEVDKKIVGKINKGFLVFIGITHKDTTDIADYLIKKLINLRIFNDANDKMNLSLKDVDGEVLLVSQFTLYANCERGNRPEFIDAAKAEKAKELYEYINKECKKQLKIVETGIFRADMKVSLINDGPVTIIMDSDEIIKEKRDKHE